LNRPLNWVRRHLGLGYWSLSAYLKLSVKQAVNFIGAFETAVATEARKHNASGIICGHIHHASDRMIDGIHYLNSGDWVESCTAIVEHTDGRMEIIRWPQRVPDRADAARGTAKFAQRVETLRGWRYEIAKLAGNRSTCKTPPPLAPPPKPQAFNGMTPSSSKTN
jgi:hypothetical protein